MATFSMIRNGSFHGRMIAPGISFARSVRPAR
jgi:hypothetical protein